MADFFDSLSSDSFIIPGIGTATNRPYEAPIIKGVTGRVEAPVNSNDGGMGVVMRRSMISSYTRRTTFDGSRYGIDLSDFYAFRLNFIPIKDETLEDARGSLKVYFRDQIAIGAVDTWQDLTGSISREWDFTKDIVTGAGANLVDYIQNFDSAGAVNQDIVFIRKSLLDIVDLTGFEVTPKILLFQGATQISSLGEELENISHWKYNFYNGMKISELEYIGSKYLDLTLTEVESGETTSQFRMKDRFVTEDGRLGIKLNHGGAVSESYYFYDLSSSTQNNGGYLIRLFSRFIPSENIISDGEMIEILNNNSNTKCETYSRILYINDSLRVQARGYKINVNPLNGSVPVNTHIFYKFKILNESSNFILWYRFGRIDNLPTI